MSWNCCVPRSCRASPAWREQLRPTLVTTSPTCACTAPPPPSRSTGSSPPSSAPRATPTADYGQHIGWRLDNLQPAEAQGNWERWIKDYWARRLDNHPVRLTADEGRQMLDWVLCSADLFPTAVGLLVKSPSRFPGAFLFFRNLKDSPVLARHPAENCRARSPRPNAPRRPGRGVRRDRLGPAQAHRHRRPRTHTQAPTGLRGRCNGRMHRRSDLGQRTAELSRCSMR